MMVESNDAPGWENAILEGGPADGLRMRVTDRPGVLQVTYPCPVDSSPDEAEGKKGAHGVQVEALYVYRRDLRVRSEPLKYGYDRASP